MEQFGWFDGKEARIQRSGGMINIYYGGRSGSTPDSERGAVIVSNAWDVMYGNDLRSHLTGFC